MQAQRLFIGWRGRGVVALGLIATGVSIGLGAGSAGAAAAAKPLFSRGIGPVLPNDGTQAEVSIECRGGSGGVCRGSVALVPRGADREAVAAQVKRRFGWSRPVIGTSTELVDHYGRLAARGIERVYTWFCDFAPPKTLAEFGEEVIAPLGPSNGR